MRSVFVYNSSQKIVEMKNERFFWRFNLEKTLASSSVLKGVHMNVSGYLFFIAMLFRSWMQGRGVLAFLSTKKNPGEELGMYFSTASCLCGKRL